jgi:hypothetical protein
VLFPVVALFAQAYTDFVPREFGRYVGWYDIDASGVRAVQSAELNNAVVLVEFDYWTDYAPFFPQNNLTFDGNVVYAIDRGRAANQPLFELYPGRDFYRYAGGKVEPVARPISSDVPFGEGDRG